MPRWAEGSNTCEERGAPSFREWEDVRAAVEAITPVGEHVVARSRFSGRAKASGVSMDFMSAATVFTIRRGQVVRLALDGSEHEALAAVRLSEELDHEACSGGATRRVARGALIRCGLGVRLRET